MLILTRRVSETIFIDSDSIQVTVLGIMGRTVRIGIQAPKSVSVHREEVYRRIKAESRTPNDCRLCGLGASTCKCEIASNE